MSRRGAPHYVSLSGSACHQADIVTFGYACLRPGLAIPCGRKPCQGDDAFGTG